MIWEYFIRQKNNFIVYSQSCRLIVFRIPSNLSIVHNPLKPIEIYVFCNCFNLIVFDELSNDN
jgi:hypothetical protein